MTRTRRTIQKIKSREPVGIDAQFWPVVVALCLTASLAAGAAMALLSGPWMWGSLLALPLVVLLSVLVLQNIPHGWLRRSLQLALLGSIGIHLLILLIATFTEIFHGIEPREVVRNSPQKSAKVLIVQQRQAPHIWQQIQQRPPEETPVEETPRTATEIPTPSEQTLPTLAAPETQAVSERITKRNDSSAAPPRLSETSSLARRSESSETPRSGGQILPDAQSRTPRQSHARPSSTAATLPQQPQTPNVPREQNQQSVEATPLPRSVQTPQAVVARREEKGQASQDSLPALSTARLRERQSEISQMSQQPGDASTPRKTPAQRLAETSETVTPPNRTVATKSVSSLSESLAREAPSVPSPTATTAAPPTNQRRETTPTTPSLTIADTQQPRRARSEDTQPSSPTPLERPAQPSLVRAENQRQPEMAQTSLTRGDGGGALANDSSNLAPNNVPASGLAAQAASAAQRREASPMANVTESLTSQQAANERRSVAQQELSAAAMQVNTEIVSRLTGQRRPAAESTESSAAEQTSSLKTESTSRLAADVGDLVLDAGSTKSLAEQNLTRTVMSGGGASDLGPLQTTPLDNTARKSTGQTPSLNSTSVAASPAAPRSNGTNESSSPTEAGETLAAANGQRTTESARSSSSRGMDLAVANTSAETNRSNANPTKRDSGEDEEEELQEPPIDDDTRPGNQPSRISRASNVLPSVAWASNESGTGSQGRGRSKQLPAPQDGVENARTVSATLTAATDTIPGMSENTSNQTGSASLTRNRTAQFESSLPDGSFSGSDTAREQAERRPTAPSITTPGLESKSSLGRVESPDEGASPLPSDRIATSGRTDLNAPLGPSGLGDRSTPEVGLPVRPAQRDSNNLQLSSPDRFVRDNSASTPMTRTDAVAATDGFRQRTPTPSGGGPSTEAAIELGLQFLARFQRNDGSWALEDFDRDHPMARDRLQSSSAATGLSLLAFQGAGYNHREYKYAAPMQLAVDWLVSHQAVDGGLYVSSDQRSDTSCRMYSHAIATLALTEAYGMTQDPRLREPCQRALDYIADTQDPQRGGWRYYAELDMRRTDTSVTGWMMMALQSGRLAGLETNEETWRGIQSWLDLAHAPRQEEQFRYDPFAPESQVGQRNVTSPMTAVGLLMRLYGGWDRDDRRLLSGAEFLLQTPPSYDSSLQRDTYYWYYATQVLRHVGGEPWARWNGRLHPLLVSNQIKTGELAGSWDPYSPVPDRWGGAAGRLYVTTMNLLSLEVDYRLLPLYEKTTR